MKKEKVYIIVTHKHNLTATSTKDNPQWEVAESIEFVSNIKKRHYELSSAIGDYINRKMLKGTAVGMGAYEVFEKYIREKYSKQMDQLDTAYNKDRVIVDEAPVEEPTITDQFGNERAPTVFDKVA